MKKKVLLIHKEKAMDIVILAMGVTYCLIEKEWSLTNLSFGLRGVLIITTLGFWHFIQEIRQLMS